MKKFHYALALAGFSFVTNKSFAAGPTVELIAADESSHVCKTGFYGGWNSLSGTSIFEKLVEFQTEKFQNSRKKLKFKSNWWNYNFGLHFDYTYFFDRKWGWNVIDFKGGYNQYATYRVDEGKNVKNSANTFSYNGFSFDVMTGVAYNFKRDGLDFEEGNQFGNRLVFNFNVGLNINLSSFSIKGEPAFTQEFLPAHFDGTTQWWRAVAEPSLEWVGRNGFLAKGALNINYFGPWNAEKRQDEDFDLIKNKVQKLSDTFSIAPTVEFGWDFSALIN